MLFTNNIIQYSLQWVTEHIFSSTKTWSQTDVQTNMTSTIVLFFHIWKNAQNHLLLSCLTVLSTMGRYMSLSSCNWLRWPQMSCSPLSRHRLWTVDRIMISASPDSNWLCNGHFDLSNKLCVLGHLKPLEFYTIHICSRYISQLICAECLYVSCWMRQWMPLFL
jgi:hypothetical protein